MWNRLFVLIFLLSSAAQARVIHSIEYRFSPAFLDNLERALSEAFSRPDKGQTPVIAMLYDGEKKVPAYLSCRAGNPRADGYGCFVTFAPTLPTEEGRIRVSIQKPVNLSFLREQIGKLKAKLQAADPARTTEHLHIGNPLASSELEDDGSHYFCQASTDKKSWDCRFYVRE